MSLLEVSDLRVSFSTADGVVKAVRGVSFSVDTGKTLGIVGESGSGKTVLTQTLLGLAPGGQVSGRAMFGGKDLLTLRPEQLRQVALDRGDEARYQDITENLLVSLKGLIGHGRLGQIFSESSTVQMRRDVPVVFDVSSIDDSDQTLQAAALVGAAVQAGSGRPGGSRHGNGAGYPEVAR